MALREFVTASDMCTPDGGAGPSNAAAGLANTLLGRSAKDQERLREVIGLSFASQNPCQLCESACGRRVPWVCCFAELSLHKSLHQAVHVARCVRTLLRCLQLPGIQGQPGPSVYRPAQAHTINAIAEAAVQGELFAQPAVAPSSRGLLLQWLIPGCLRRAPGMLISCSLLQTCWLSVSIMVPGLCAACLCQRAPCPLQVCRPLI